jgi:hypothetical protein
MDRPKVSAHVSRIPFGVTAVPMRISLQALQRLPGHDRLATTAIHSNLSPDHVIKNPTTSGR